VMGSARVLSAVCLGLVGAASASAQSYVFSSCGSGVTFRASITSVTSVSGPFPDGAGGRQFAYIVMGNYSLTRGQSTQVSSGLGSVSISYTASPALSPQGPITGFILEAPNAAGTGGPGLGVAASSASIPPAFAPGGPDWGNRSMAFTNSSKGTALVLSGTAADVTGVLAAFGVTAQALGVYEIATGEVSIQRGISEINCDDEPKLPPYNPQSCPNQPLSGIRPVVGPDLNGNPNVPVY
jgi:hypothetical protein